MAGEVKNVWLGKRDADVREFIENVGNFSEWVKQAIRKEIERQRTGIDPNIRDMVELLIEERLAGHVFPDRKELAPDEQDDIDQFF